MIKLYDTRAKRKVDFEPIEEGRVRMYVCGPTVYNRIHIGNARTFISFDTIRRYFIWRGYDVTFVQNITDVDDKIINRANEEGRTAAEVAADYTDAFIDDMHAAGVLDPSVQPKATEEIDTMIDLVQRLIDSGHAYEVEGDVYFAVRSFDGYGELSGRDVDDMESGHRELRAEGLGLEERKRDPLDFALWKAAKPGEPAWDSPWGQGRPGWHIECSAMSHKYLGLPFDIHGGGSDLAFPHHENERAQSEAAYGCTFAKYWMHSGMLQIVNEETGEEEKMSKSLNNFLLLHEVLETVKPPVLRMLMLQTHYRSPLVFGQARISDAASALERLENVLTNLEWIIEHPVVSGNTEEPNDAASANANTIANTAAQTNANAIANADAPADAQTDATTQSEIDCAALQEAQKRVVQTFEQAMDDDFNTAGALGGIFTFVADINTLVIGRQASDEAIAALTAARDTLVELVGVLGIDLAATDDSVAYPVEVVALAADVAGYTGSDTTEAVDALLDVRTAARAEKNWAVADSVRDGLAALGLHIEDTAQGPRIAAD